MNPASLSTGAVLMLFQVVAAVPWLAVTLPLAQNRRPSRGNALSGALTTVGALAMCAALLWLAIATRFADAIPQIPVLLFLVGAVLAALGFLWSLNLPASTFAMIVAIAGGVVLLTMPLLLAIVDDRSSLEILGR